MSESGQFKDFWRLDVQGDTNPRWKRSPSKLGDQTAKTSKIVASGYEIQDGGRPR